MTIVRAAGLSGRKPRQSTRRSWPAPAALLLLSVVPLLAGAFRVVQLLGGPELIPADDRFAGFPLPLIIHIVGAMIYLVVGAFEFVPRFRRSTRAGTAGLGGCWQSPECWWPAPRCG